MATIGTFVNQDGVAFEINYGQPFPCDAAARPSRTIFLAPDPCYVCGSTPSRGCDIRLSEQTALLVSQRGLSLPEAIVTFRSNDRMRIGRGFPLSGVYRLVLGRMTSEMLQAITLLYLSQNVFETTAYPAPYEGEWKRRAISYTENVVKSIIDPAYVALANEPRSAIGLSRLHEIVLGVIRFIPRSILLTDLA